MNDLSVVGTLPLRVANTGFMLDRLGMDCDELQFLRELTKNSIEAIQRLPDKKGEIFWDADTSLMKELGRACLSITDNGAGMSGEEMVRYINHLSSSSSLQSHVANYGVGAKISAAPRNPAGMQYLSWKDGVGYFIHFWKDPKTNEYGLKHLPSKDDPHGHWLIIPNKDKPAGIGKHGTKVILLGTRRMKASSTMDAPVGTPMPSKWIVKYLNTRFFQIPDGITIKAREGWDAHKKRNPDSFMRTVIGQKAYLDKHAEHHGQVVLTNATAHWWILEDDKSLLQNSGIVASSGHTAALYQDELYEMSHGRGSTAMLQGFGVIFGSQRVVIYIEPTGERITTNTARTTLLIHGKPTPWVEWQDEFRSKMPKAIQRLMAHVAAQSSKKDHSSSIRDRLQAVKDLFDVSTYRRSHMGGAYASGGAAGPLLFNENDKHTVAFEAADAVDEGGETEKKQTKEKNPLLALFETKKGKKARDESLSVYPKIKWIGIEEGTRVEGDMEDRAARYLHKENLLLINSDFRIFRDMIKRWTNQFKHVPDVGLAVREVVREWFEQTLVETVISANSLRGSKFWPEEKIENELLSDQGLTAVVLPRYHIDYSIKRSLASKLGTLKEPKKPSKRSKMRQAEEELAEA